MRRVLLLAFLVVPLVELWILIQVGQVIGASWTILLLVLISLIGALLVRREGTRAWGRFRNAMREARLPADEVLDGALVLLGGALMLTPGFATDAVGLALILPPTRAPVAALLRTRLRRAFRVSDQPGSRPPSRPGAEIVDVEVITIERNPAPRPDNGVASGSSTAGDAG